MPKIRIYLSLSLLVGVVVTACTLPATLANLNSPTATPSCVGQIGELEMTTPSTEVLSGEPVIITVTLSNTTCGGMGLLLYRLYPDPETALEPIEPLDYPTTVPPGGTHTVEFEVIPAQPGEVTITARVSFEGTSPDGTFFWGGVQGKTPLALTVYAE